MNEYLVEFQVCNNLDVIQVARVFADSKADAVMDVGNTYDVYFFFGVRRLKDD